MILWTAVFIMQEKGITDKEYTMSKNRVLIVEDEISIAKVINMNLKVANYDTVMFHDGAKA